MAIVSMKNVVDYFNSIVKQYLDDGWKISPTTINGGYCHVKGYTDLVNSTKKKIARVFIANEIKRIDKIFCEDRYCDTIKVLAKEYDWDGKYGSTNLWLDYGKPFHEKLYYSIKGMKAYADSLDDLKTVNDLRIKRKNDKKLSKNYVKTFKLNRFSADFVDNIMRRINAKRGFKRATASCIDNIVLYKEESYYHDRLRAKGKIEFSYNGKSDSIYLS